MLCGNLNGKEIQKRGVFVYLYKGTIPQAAARVQSLGQDAPLEKGMATHSSILAWRISGTEEPSGLLSMGSHRLK